MVKSNHTPGPWYVVDNGESALVRQENSDYVLAITDDGGYLQSGIECIDYHEQVANAELMAAAPDMKKALEVIAVIEDPVSGDRGPIRYARHIAKCTLKTIGS